MLRLRCGVFARARVIFPPNVEDSKAPMANIKQQKKRVITAQRQRFENLRYKSTVKTLFRSLQDAVNLGDKPAAEASHRELVRLLDRAGARRVLHPNTVARKKARAERVLVSEPVKEAKVVRRAKKSTQRKPKAATSATEAAAAEKSPAAKAKAAKTGAKKPAAAAPDTSVKEAVAAAEPVDEVTADVEASKPEDAPAEGVPAEDAPVEAAGDASEATAGDAR